jgi:hypothetical protein
MRVALISSRYSSSQELPQLLAKQLKFFVHLNQSVVRTLVVKHEPGTLNHLSARVRTWIAKVTMAMFLLEALVDLIRVSMGPCTSLILSCLLAGIHSSSSAIRSSVCKMLVRAVLRF